MSEIAWGWYEERIEKALAENPEARRAAVNLISREADEPLHEELIELETVIWGERVECPHDCGSLVLPGAPACWGCEQEIQWPREEEEEKP